MQEQIQDDVRIFRIRNHKTQEQMADIIGCSTSTYIQKEKNRTDFTIEEIKIIKAYFNLSIEKTWHIFFDE